MSRAVTNEYIGCSNALIFLSLDKVDILCLKACFHWDSESTLSPSGNRPLVCSN